MFRATPGAVRVSYGGVDGWGHKGLPPGLAFEDPELTVGKPSVVVAAGHFPGIGVDDVNGQQRVTATNIDVDGHEWRIARVLQGDEDGGTIVLMLTHPS